jgi:hypothetical protein
VADTGKHFCKTVAVRSAFTASISITAESTYPVIRLSTAAFQETDFPYRFRTDEAIQTQVIDSMVGDSGIEPLTPAV